MRELEENGLGCAPGGTYMDEAIQVDFMSFTHRTESAEFFRYFRMFCNRS